ncbi:hypothetical protein WJX82_002415 [Trebouxia sp. C0006]
MPTNFTIPETRPSIEVACGSQNSADTGRSVQGLRSCPSKACALILSRCHRTRQLQSTATATHLVRFDLSDKAR